MLNNDLKFNDDKSEFLIIGSSQQLENLDNISIRVGDSDIHPVPLARNLGCWFDSRLSMASHITKLCNSSFYFIYNIRRIRKYLSRQSTEILVHAFLKSRLDYCNGLLYGLPDCLLNKLQRVQNACARLIFREQKFCHVTLLIHELHWLPIKYRIEFKILLITFKILNFLAPTYLSSLISLRLISKYNLRNSSDKLLLSYPRFKSKATLGPVLHRNCGMRYHLAQLVFLKPSEKLTFSVMHCYHSCFYYFEFTLNCNFSFLNNCNSLLAFLFRF